MVSRSKRRRRETNGDNRTARNLGEDARMDSVKKPRRGVEVEHDDEKNRISPSPQWR